MEVLQAVLDLKPSNWEYKSASSYSNSYLLCDVPQYFGSEWYSAINGLEPYAGSIITVKRIQNPFQWGLLRIQSEKRTNEYLSGNKMTGYHVIHTTDLDTALKYPLDYRRYSHRNLDIQTNGKNPKFFTTFYEAYSARHSLLDSNNEIIILKCEYLSSPKNQGDYYPSYAIRLIG